MTKKMCYLLAGLCALVYLPFVTKGVTYDDFVFLDYAKRLTKNPSVCVVEDYVFQGLLIEDLVVFESTHPPLIPYWIRVVTHLFGENLLVLHLAFFPFLLLATLAFGEAIARFTRFSPLLAPALTLGPLFLPIATNLMTDVPLFAFWFSALICWDRALFWKRITPWHLATLLFANAAFFTAYQGLGLIAIFLLMGLFRQRFRVSLVWAAIALLPFAIWILMVWINYHFLPYFAPPREVLSIATEVTKGMLVENMWIKARVIFLYLGAGLGFFLAWGLGPRPKIWLALAGWALALTAFLFEGPVFLNNLLPWLLFTLGLATLPVLFSAWRRFQNRQGDEYWQDLVLLACVAGFGLFQIGVAAFAAPRYILILLGAVFLLVLRTREPSKQGTLLLPALLPTLALGLLVTCADWVYADAQRVQALDLPKDKSIFFLGEKGLKYSAERLGYQYLLPGRENEVNYLLVPDEIDKIPLPTGLKDKLEEIDRFPIQSWLPIRVMNRAANAGLYIHTRGLLPFTFSQRRVEEYTFYRCYQRGNPDWFGDVYQARPAGEITSVAPVYQDFYCPSPGLTRLRMMVATYNRVNHSSLVASLLELHPNGETSLVFRQSLDASTLEDNSWRQFDFPSLNSKGKRYRFLLASPDAIQGNGVTIWTNSSIVASFYWGEQQKDGMLVLEAWCLPGEGN